MSRKELREKSKEMTLFSLSCKTSYGRNPVASVPLVVTAKTQNTCSAVIQQGRAHHGKI